MTRIGATSPDMMRTIVEVVRYLKQSGFVVGPPSMGGREVQQSTPIYVRNDSAETMPPFACMQVTGTVENGGQNYITANKPVDADGTAGGYLFNGFAAIEAGGFGIANDGPVVRTLVAGSPSSGAALVPVVASWSVAIGDGPLFAIGADDIASGVVRAFTSTANSGGNGKLYGFQLTNNGFLTTETAAADIYELNGAVFGSIIDDDAPIYDPSKWAAGAPIDLRGLCMKQGGKYYAIQAPCDVETP